MLDEYEVVLTGTREVEGVKCLLTNRIVFTPITHTLEYIDALIFTSVYAIKSLIESASCNPHLARWIEIPSFVISEASAKALYECGALVEYVGKKTQGKAFAAEICPLLKERNPLYLRAKKIVSGLDSILQSEGIKLEEVIAYENIPLDLHISLKPPPHSVIIFTAPSSYHSFIKNFGWDSQYRAIAIGESTFAHFDTDIKAYISPSTSISGCIAFAKELALKSNL